MPTPEHLIQVNRRFRMYVVPIDGKYKYLFFDECLQQGNAAADWLTKLGYDQRPIPEDLLETATGYNCYAVIMERAEEVARRNGKPCPVCLTPQLIGLEGKRVAVVDRNGNGRKFYVGISPGWLPKHLELSNPGGNGREVFGAPFADVICLS